MISYLFKGASPIVRLLGLLLLVCSPTTRAADYFVATNGNDATGDGSIGKPWATIQNAITATSHHGQADYAAQKNIWVRGGAYYNVTVGMDMWNSANFLISSYSNETAVLYGGQLLTNWTGPDANGCYTAKLGTFPSVSATVGLESQWEPRTLVAGNVTVPRAKAPGTGKWHYTSFSGTSLVYTNDFSSSTNGEVQCDQSWNDTELAITAVNTSTKTITTSSAMSRAGENSDQVTTFTMLNTPEGMTLSEQFWWDKTNNAIVYRGSNPNLKNMVVPTVSRVFYIQGFGTGSWITNIVISNLVVACVTAPINNGAADDSGEFYYPAIDFAYATNCAVSACSIYGCAGTGVGNHWAMCQNVSVNNSAVHDIGASGISFPGSWACTFNDNLIYNCGTLCQAGVGIWGSQYTHVLNNVVTNITGSGIAISSGSYSDKSDGVLIESNTVLRTVKQLRDMGAIYFWSCTNCHVVGNYVGEVYSASTNFYNNDNIGWNVAVGIYCDAGNYSVYVASNIIYNCTIGMIYHMSTNGAYLNNFYVNTRSEDSQLQFPNCDAPVFTNNIYVAVDHPRINAENSSYIWYSIDPSLAVKSWRGNVVWSTGGSNELNPSAAITADPLFSRRQPLSDLNFLTNSPAGPAGISPLRRPWMTSKDLHVVY